jgi:hypothetical protein
MTSIRCTSVFRKKMPILEERRSRKSKKTQKSWGKHWKNNISYEKTRNPIKREKRRIARIKSQSLKMCQKNREEIYGFDYEYIDSQYPEITNAHINKFNLISQYIPGIYNYACDCGNPELCEGHMLDNDYKEYIIHKIGIYKFDKL